MAQALTYNSVGNREDLENLVTNIAPHETPFVSSLKKVEAKASYHEWLTDTLTTYNEANKKVEGSDWATPGYNVRSRVGNYTQIFEKVIQVSGTQEAVEKAGVSSEIGRQRELKLKEIATDMEAAIIEGASASGASGTARAMKGMLAWITTNVETGTGTGLEALTETMLLDSLQDIFASGGRPEQIIANFWQKRKITGFTAGTTKFTDAMDKKLVNNVEIYEGPTGQLKVILHRAMPTNQVMIIEPGRWARAVLRPTQKKDVAPQGDYIREAIVSEETLVSYSEAASGKITGLTTA